jgi:hypothetical protein
LIYLPEYNTAFVAQSDMDVVNRMGSYFTNLKEKVKSGKDFDLKPRAILKEEGYSIVRIIGSVSQFEIKVDKDSRWNSGSSGWGKNYGS